VGTDGTSNHLDLTHCQKCGGSFGGICAQHTACAACECPAINVLGPPAQPAMLGWRCPNCGAGMSPFASRCGCVDGPLRVTCQPVWTTCVSN